MATADVTAVRRAVARGPGAPRDWLQRRSCAGATLPDAPSPASPTLAPRWLWGVGVAAGGGSPGLGAGGTVSAHAAHSPGAPSCRPLCPPSAPSTCSAPFVPGTVAMALLAAPVAPWKPPGRGKVSARDARPRARPRALDADGSCRPSRSWKLGVAREAPAKRSGCVMPADGALLASPPPR